MTRAISMLVAAVVVASAGASHAQDAGGDVQARGRARYDAGAAAAARGDRELGTVRRHRRPERTECPRTGARPLPHCRATLVGEMGVGMGGEQTTFVWDFGLLVNREDDAAIGATIGGFADDRGFHTGVKLRYRSYLSDTVSVDVGGGPVRFSTLSGSSTIGGYAQAQLNLEDWGGVGIDLSARDDDDGARWQATVNFRAGLPTIGYALLGLLTVAAGAR